MHAGIRNLRTHLHWLPPAAVAAVLIGCATTGTSSKEPTLRDDFIEFRQIVVRAMDRIDFTMRALDDLSVQADRDPKAAYRAFCKAVHELEVGSMRVRARMQAMRARGDAYFERWENYLANVDNEQVRKLAKEHRPELRQSFERGQQATQQVRETFRPFLSDLQKLRAVLEADPSLSHIASEKDLLLAAAEKGRQVQQGLDRILAELNCMVALLRPPEASPKH